ncbi:MAG TPA: DUF6702 family protein [Chitinophagaceae bacterium]|nr:DUF6702 family protein [Chitinophagaceae bacterium]
MASLVYKWFGALFLLPLFQTSALFPNSFLTPSRRAPGDSHPYYISVVEINHNATERTLEISCKIFTNDFETTLEKTYKAKVDLSNPKDKASTDKWVSDYIRKHLSLKVDGKDVNLSYLGFEKDEEAIFSYFQVDNVASARRIGVSNSLLHDFSDQQINIIHCSVGGKRQSTKLDYPNTEAAFQF